MEQLSPEPAAANAALLEQLFSPRMKEYFAALNRGRTLMTDDEREILIAYHKDVFRSAVDRDYATKAWERMRDLINGRSKERVAAMERELGLAQ